MADVATASARAAAKRLDDRGITSFHYTGAALYTPDRTVLALCLLACLLVLLLLGGAERLARDRAWRSVPLRIHVNGTRAKSTVTRLVWSALTEAGIPTIAKTTGTRPRILLPDRREVPLGRRGPANIREQLEFLRRARRAGARAAVVECMALDPILQYVSERQMVRATIGVVTNVRLDHTEVMGGDLSSIARALANTTPEGANLIVGEPSAGPVFRKRAAALGSRVELLPPGESAAARPTGRDGWLNEDLAIAVAVTRRLGLDDEVARRGFERAPRDPGAAVDGVAAVQTGEFSWLDATAANDPQSLDLLVGGFDAWQTARSAGRAAWPRVVVYNHRFDRSPRLECFASHSPVFAQADILVVSGSRPPLTVWRALARGRRAGTLRFVRGSRLGAWLADEAAGAAVVFCGNTRGIDVPRVIREAAGRD